MGLVASLQHQDAGLISWLGTGHRSGVADWELHMPQVAKRGKKNRNSELFYFLNFYVNYTHVYMETLNLSFSVIGAFTLLC